MFSRSLRALCLNKAALVGGCCLTSLGSSSGLSSFLNSNNLVFYMLSNSLMTLLANIIHLPNHLVDLHMALLDVHFQHSLHVSLSVERVFGIPMEGIQDGRVIRQRLQFPSEILLSVVTSKIVVLDSFLIQLEQSSNQLTRYGLLTL